MLKDEISVKQSINSKLFKPCPHIYSHKKGKKAKNSGGGSQKQSIIVVKYRLLPSAPLQ